MGRITITSRSVPQLGRTRADFRDDWALPATAYRLSGPRISGGVTVWAQAEPAHDHPPVLEDCDVRILFGLGNLPIRRSSFIDRKDLDDPLTVNGVPIAKHQTSIYFRPGSLADLDRCGGYLNWGLPDRTRETTTALLRFVALHWVRRDPQFLIHRICAVHHALDHWQAERRRHMTRAYRDLLDRHQTLDRLRTVADGAHQFRLAPPPGPVPSTG